MKNFRLKVCVVDRRLIKAGFALLFIFRFSLRLCVVCGREREFSSASSVCDLVVILISKNPSNFKMAFRLVRFTPNFARMMSTNATTVGFIGLGQMGNRMATNLINKVRLDDKSICARDVPPFHSRRPLE